MVLLLLLSILVFPASARALGIDAATVTFNPKKTDAFVVKGRFAPFDAATVGPVTVELGGFTQTIPLSAFTVKKGKLSFKGAKNAPGLAALTIDTGKGTFAATGKHLALAPFANPAPFRLAAGLLDECSTITFAEGKKWTLASTVPACGFQGAPLITPDAVTTGVPTDVRVRVTIRDDLALDLGSLVLLRLDAALNPTSQVCTLHDDGSPSHGDDVAVDGVFSCRFTANEPAPVRLRLAVRALRDTVLVLSPSSFLDVVSPLTEAEVVTVQTVQAAGVALWEAAVAEHGEGKKALKQTVEGIAALAGVARAAVAGDGVNIHIEYASGLTGGIDLDPVGVDIGGLPLALSARSHAPAGARAPAALAARAPAALGGPRIGNGKVLVWSAFENENDQMAAATAAVVQLFENATCPDFEVTLLKNEQCTLASIATFHQYGTVVLLTHGGQPQPKGPLGFMTREKATTFGTWLTHAEDLKLGRLLVYSGARKEKHDYFIFFPDYVAAVNPATFPNSVIFAGACSSALNRTMANAFLARGALAYFGFSDVTHATLLKLTSVGTFSGLLDPAGSPASDAFARVPFKTFKKYLDSVGFDAKLLAPESRNTLKSALTLVRGDGRLAYPCGAPPSGLVETITLPAGPMAHTVGSVVLQAGVQYRLVISGTLRNQTTGNPAEYADYDAIYCFDNYTGLCKPNDPFPNEDALYFYSQTGSEEPSFGSLETPREFTGAAGRPPYDAEHVYEFPYTGENGRLWVALWPQIFPGTGSDQLGSITVQIFRD